MEQLELMKRVRIIVHNGVRILLYDFTNLTDTEEGLAVVAYAREFIAKLPKGSVYTLTDITGSDYNDEINAALKELSKHNKPYVLFGAAVGVTGLRKVVFRSVMTLAGRTNVSLFDTREEALDWLAEQQGA